MKRIPRAAVNSSGDRIGFVMPTAKKRKLRARLAMEGVTLSALARIVCDAYAEKRKIEIDGKSLEDLLRES